jgi:hypothetical protein
MRITTGSSHLPRIARSAALAPFVAGAAAAGAQAPPVIRGQDIEGRATTVVYEAGRWTLVGLTDRAHRTELADWLRAVAPAADSALTRRYVVVALPRTVPPPFRGAIRSAFRRPGPWTYLLDWGGADVAGATARRGLPCLLVVAPDGLVADHPCGAADSARVGTVRARLAPRPTLERP